MYIYIRSWSEVGFILLWLTPWLVQRGELVHGKNFSPGYSYGANASIPVALRLDRIPLDRVERIRVVAFKKFSSLQWHLRLET